ncbi:hypothetical protein M9435_000380 [Picochlorum sp. BPE23]|nr:hypothetical protein M9435_000380 [Picochlorum sp. BPE23]
MLRPTLSPLSEKEDGSTERKTEKHDIKEGHWREVVSSQEVERRRDSPQGNLSKKGAVVPSSVDPHLREDCDAGRSRDNVQNKTIPPLPTKHVMLPRVVRVNEKQSIDRLFFPFFKVYPEMWDKFNRDYNKYEVEILRAYIQWANVIRQLSNVAKQASASAQIAKQASAPAQTAKQASASAQIAKQASAPDPTAKEERVGSTTEPPLEVELSPSMWDGGRGIQWLEAYKKDLMIQKGEKEPKRQKVDDTATGE